MINDPITKVMQDASEIVRYDEVGIPLYIREGLLSSYPDHRALCHWHEDIEWVLLADFGWLIAILINNAY